MAYGGECSYLWSRSNELQDYCADQGLQILTAGSYACELPLGYSVGRLRKLEHSEKINNKKANTVQWWATNALLGHVYKHNDTHQVPVLASSFCKYFKICVLSSLVILSLIFLNEFSVNNWWIMSVFKVSLMCTYKMTSYFILNKAKYTQCISLVKMVIIIKKNSH